MKKLLLLFACFCTLMMYGSETLSIRMNDGIDLLGNLSLPEGHGNVPLIVVFVPGTGSTNTNSRKG